MPCYDPRDNRDAMDAIRAEGELFKTQQLLRKIEAMLCGVLNAAKATDKLDDIMAVYSPTTSGVDVLDVLRWFSQHQEADMETYARQRDKK